MSLQIAFTIVLSSLSWALFDMSRKKLATRLAPVPAVVWLMLLQTPLYLFFLASESWVVPESGYWLPALASILLNCLANVLFIRSVGLAPLSLAIPILSLTPVFSSFGAFALLEEPTTIRQAVGIAIIVVTTFALGRSGVKQEPEIQSQTHAVRKGLVFMAVVAGLWATTPVLDKICLKQVPSSEHAFIQCLGIALLLAAWQRIRGGDMAVSDARGAWRWLAAAVIVASSALLAQFWSIQFVPVGIFEALKRSIGLISALGLGLFVFREPITRVKAAMVVVMGIGIFVLLT